MKTTKNTKQQNTDNTEKLIKQNTQYKKRNVGLQTIGQTKEYIPPSVAVQHNLEPHDYPKIVAIPHNILTLLFISGILFYLGTTSTGDFFKDAKRGYLGAVAAFLVLGCAYLPDSMLRRPHPIIWRLVLSVSIVYLLNITFLLFQSPSNARSFLTFYDKSLGVPLPEKSYGDKCEVFINTYPYIKLDNIYDSLDVYLTAHLVGWFVKMLIVRDVYLCWFLSILFEIMELTFKHILPNFNECWWDHLFLDIFGCNALGIWLGHITCKYLEMYNYKWISKNNEKYSYGEGEIKENPNKNDYKKRIINMLSYFTPNYWVKHEWSIFSSVKRFYAVLWYVAFMMMVDLSNFFMKFELWMPNTHFLLGIRIYTWALMAAIATREYYEYITNRSCKRLGPFVWVSHLILFVEYCMIYKFSDSPTFKIPYPKYVIYFWVGVFILISMITVHLVIKDFRKYLDKNKDKKEENIDLFEPKIEVEYVDE
jgi:phosphatidylserine synthase 2